MDGEPRGMETPAAPIEIVSEGHAVPFSKGLLAQSLTATGLGPERAYRVARLVEKQLTDKGMSGVGVSELRTLVEQVLGDAEGARFVERYHKWYELSLQDRPVIILIGGATGVGKSTLATQLAVRLGITRIISTDAIREVMRAFFSAQLMPAIHFSSFEAAGAVKIPVAKKADPSIVGFVEQVEMVNAGVAAVIDRAISEGTSMVIEGVHLVPGSTRISGSDQAIILPLVVVVRGKELHRSHFLVRDTETDGKRPRQRYLKHFSNIRKIQDYIIGRAGKEGTLVIENRSIDDAAGMIVDSLYELIEGSQAEQRTSAAIPGGST